MKRYTPLYEQPDWPVEFDYPQGERIVRAGKLTDEEQDEFVEDFYNLSEVMFDDKDCSTPWGLPWLTNKYEPLHGNTIRDMAKNYWEDNKDEIIKCLKNTG